MNLPHKRVYLPVVLAAAVVLTGCAGERAFREGKQLVEEGKVEQGLVELERAVQHSPDDIRYRSYYYRQREHQVNQLLAQADMLREMHQYDEATAAYQRILLIDPSYDRASAGVAASLAGKRHAALVAEAEALYKNGKLDGAQSLLQKVLLENPRHVPSRELLHRVEERRAKERDPGEIIRTTLKRPLTIEFRDSSLKSVFDIISRSANINFVLDKDVRPDLKTSITVKNASIEDILDFILVTNQLEKKILSENSLLIYPNTPAKVKDYQELVMRSFYLANADAKQTLSMIKTLVKTKDIYVDEKLNMLVMRDTPEVIRVVEKLIAMQDMPEPEVTLAVEVLEVSSGRLSELGIRYPNQVSAGLLGATGLPGQLTLDEFKARSSDLVRLTFNDPLLVANLRAQDGGSNLLANPRIRVKNHDKAKIHIGDRVPVITSTSTSTGFVSESVSYLDVGLKLDVEPTVYLDNEVSIKIGLEVSNIVSEITSKSGTLTYRVGTRNAFTSLRLKHGETQILAGLISDEERNSADKVPGLGDLPVIGRLFSNNKDTTNKTEIVLLITPYVIRNIAQPAATTVEFTSGTESVMGTSPLRLNQAAAIAGRASTGPAQEAPAVVPAPAAQPEPAPLPTATVAPVETPAAAPAPAPLPPVPVPLPPPPKPVNGD